MSTDDQVRGWDAFVAASNANGLCEFSGMRVTKCVRTICDCFETPEGASQIERNAGLYDAPQTPESRRLNCPVCGSGETGDCVCPEATS